MGRVWQVAYGARQSMTRWIAMDDGRRTSGFPRGERVRRFSESEARPEGVEGKLVGVAREMHPCEIQHSRPPTWRAGSGEEPSRLLQSTRYAD